MSRSGWHWRSLPRRATRIRRPPWNRWSASVSVRPGAAVRFSARLTRGSRSRCSTTAGTEIFKRRKNFEGSSRNSAVASGVLSAASRRFSLRASSSIATVNSASSARAESEFSSNPQHSSVMLAPQGNLDQALKSRPVECLPPGGFASPVRLSRLLPTPNRSP